MYIPKTTFSGYKIGLSNEYLYIGIPDKYWKGESVAVSFNGKIRYFHPDDVVTSRVFDDKFRPGETYELLYVLWEKKV